MRISGMPDTEITLSDGQISIFQKGVDGDHDHSLYFPVELAEKIANEIRQLAGLGREQPDTAHFPALKPFPKG